MRLAKDKIEKFSMPVPWSGCWVWVGALCLKDYPSVRWNGRTVRGNRLSYEAYNGPIPEGLVVRHTCDNPTCVNPDHLITGTYKENSGDIYKRGRRKLKLTKEDFRYIKENFKHRDKEFGLTGLARKFGVTKQYIKLIVEGKKGDVAYV